MQLKSFDCCYIRNEQGIMLHVSNLVNSAWMQSLWTYPCIIILVFFVVHFFQFDIRGNPYGFLAAHPLVPLVSLHHLDQLSPFFPNQTQLHSMKKLISAYHIDPARIVQQSICYDHKRRWSISISWGYTIQIYTKLLIAADLQMPLQTFQTWRSWKDGPFIFNTRPMSSDPCQQPARFFLDQATKVGKSGSITIYKRHEGKEAKCNREGTNNEEVQRIRVSALKLDPEYWKNVPLSLSLPLSPHTHACTYN